MSNLELGASLYLDGRASDPRQWGWMVGAPPPANRHVSFADGTFRDFPQNRWSLSHMRELMPTVNIWRGPVAPSPFTRDDQSIEIGALEFSDAGGKIRRFDEALSETYVDGIMVLHRGRILFERYFGALEPHLPHSTMSITKSYAGTLATALVHEGVLDGDKLVPYYIPELRGTAWDQAKLRHVMDMQTGLAFSEDYTDNRSDGQAFERAGGLRAWPIGEAGPRTMCDYLLTFRQNGAHGKMFAYKSPNAAVMAWVMSRVTGLSLAQLLQQRLWGPLCCEENGEMIVDPDGTPMAGGGLNASLRDLARFGELMRLEGAWNGQQLIPTSAVHDIRAGGDRERFDNALYPGYSYRSMWWITHDELDAYEARGAHGQLLYIAPKAEMVVACYSSQPTEMYDFCAAILTPQMLALGRMLRA
ncbi:serine hydrolase domain-containing protein [Rhizobium miluonense]|uniref:Beta-lactamase-related domain-containing protein n=1 Tax=Rhizobium miluonense TaxID=411945 RepID=A0A1C3XBN2_9HYPH|nr:serine hydrolase [Rhizobium miluonense]SCB49575.1 hypothetical protein GA0061102_10765 [Rhizobium miluonense]